MNIVASLLIALQLMCLWLQIREADDNPRFSGLMSGIVMWTPLTIGIIELYTGASIWGTILFLLPLMGLVVVSVIEYLTQEGY